MDGETLTLRRAELTRCFVLNQVLEGVLTNAEAALVVGVSVRHLRRLRTAYRRAGPQALVHGNRGRRPWQAVPEQVRQRVVDLAASTYVGLNHQHLTEKLADEGLVLGRTTVRRILAAAGLFSPRPRRARAHRR